MSACTKLNRPARYRRFGDQLRLHAFVDGVEEAIFRQVSERFEDLDVELASETAARLSVRLHASLRRDSRRPMTSLTPSGKPRAVALLPPPDPVVKRVERTGFRQMSEHFADEKRIALGAVRPRGA